MFLDLLKQLGSAEPLFSMVTVLLVGGGELLAIAIISLSKATHQLPSRRDQRGLHR